MNALSAISTRSSGAPALMPTSLTEAMSLATMMSQSKLVPAALQKSPADCLLVIEQAMRWGMSPFAVAQEVSVIQGKMMFSGKIVAAAVHTSGVLEGRLRYDYEGADAKMIVTVTGTLRGESDSRDVKVSLASAKTGNQWWIKTPEQMLAYHGARVWARRNTPEVMLGVYSPEEFEEPQPRDIGPQRDTPRPVPQIARRPLDAVLDNDQIPDFDAPPPPQPSPLEKATLWLQPILDRLSAASDQDAYNLVMQTPKLRPGLQAIERDFPTLYAQYEEVRAVAMERIVPKHEPQYEYESPTDSETA